MASYSFIVCAVSCVFLLCILGVDEMKMISVKLHRDLYEGLEKVCSLYDKPDVTVMLNAVVLSFLNNVGLAPQSGIFAVEVDEQ